MTFKKKKKKKKIHTLRKKNAEWNEQTIIMHMNGCCIHKRSHWTRSVIAIESEDKSEIKSYTNVMTAINIVYRHHFTNGQWVLK